MRKFAAILAVIAALAFVEVADARLLHGGKLFNRRGASCGAAVQSVLVVRVRERQVFRAPRAGCSSGVRLIPAVSSSCGTSGPTLMQAEKIAPAKKK